MEKERARLKKKIVWGLELYNNLDRRDGNGK